MLMGYKRGQGSIIIRFKVLDSAATTGAGKTGLTSASSGLIISTIADNEATPTTYTVAGSTIESIATLGTFAAPTATKCRFKEVDSTNHKGVYELQLADARYAVSSAKSLLVSLSGPTGAAETDFVVPLTDLDPYDVVRLGATSLPNVVSGSAGAIPTTGSGANQIAVNGDGKISGVVLADTVTTYTGNTPQTGDNYPRLGAPAGASMAADIAAVKTDTGNLVTRLTAARAGYMDNLNVGGAVASQADITALNQSASRRIIITTVQQYERPESGSVTYTIELRTYDGDGEAVNADSTPSVTATGSVSGSLAANLAAASNPATGVYRLEYTVTSVATSEQIRIDASVLLSAATFTLSAYTQVVDEVSATWTATDATHLTTIFNKLPTNNMADQTLVMAAIDDLPTNAELATSFTGFATTLATAHGAGSWATPVGFSTHSAADVWAVGTRTLTSGAAPSAADIADAVWDEVLSGHLVSGSAAVILVAAGGAGDPMSVDVSSGYPEPQAGYYIYRSRLLPLNPTVVDASERNSGDLASLVAYRGEVLRCDPLHVIDSEGESIPLTGRALALVFQTSGNVWAFEWTTAAGTLVITTVDGDDSYLQLLGPKLGSNFVGTYRFNLRDITGGYTVKDEFLGAGELVIHNYRDHVV